MLDGTPRCVRPRGVPRYIPAHGISARIDACTQSHTSAKVRCMGWNGRRTLIISTHVGCACACAAAWACVPPVLGGDFLCPVGIRLLGLGLRWGVGWVSMCERQGGFWGRTCGRTDYVRLPEMAKSNRARLDMVCFPHMDTCMPGKLGTPSVFPIFGACCFARSSSRVGLRCRMLKVPGEAVATASRLSM